MSLAFKKVSASVCKQSPAQNKTFAPFPFLACFGVFLFAINNKFLASLRSLVLDATGC
jgi:hypothetical protein